MDFSVLLADLRAVAEKYEGKKSEPQVSTLAYVDMFTKILRRAQKVTDNYDDQITVLWVALNQLASIYKDLTPGNARDSLCKFIFSMCAKTVLNVQWSQLDEDSEIKNNFCATLGNVNEILSPLGFTRFQLIQDLMESPWTHPVLSQIMAGEEEPEGGVEYIVKEDPDILKLRIEIMMKENCEEFALNLCEWSLKHPELEHDLKIKEHQISILYSQSEYSKMQEVCSTIVCHDGIKVMSHLAKIPANQPLCIRLAQVFLIQDWIRVERTCCTQELLKLWIHHQYLADKDEERFLDSIWTVAKVCRNTGQIGTLLDGVRKECGDMFIQLYSELCKYAINIDKGNLEREHKENNWEEANTRKIAISKTCVRMAFLFKEYDFRISRICGLTAFALVPTTENLNLVNKLYWTIKNTSATSENSKINPATIYEVERLLGHLRPEMLNPDYSWKQLIPVCKKYKLDHDKGILGNGILEMAYSTSAGLSAESCEVDSSKYKAIASTEPDAKKAAKQKNKGSRRKEEIPKDIQKAHLEKLLLQNKDLSKEKIEEILCRQFPRSVDTDLKSGPPLTVKQLDKTIDDLKQSIYLETHFRETLEKNISTLQQADVDSSAAMKASHANRVDKFRQDPKGNMQAHKQQGSHPGAFVVRSPPHPLGFNNNGNSSSSTGDNDAPGNNKQQYHTTNQHLQAQLQQSQQPQSRGKSYLKSPTAAQGSQHSKQVADELHAQIKKEASVQNQQQKGSQKEKRKTTTHPNILRPPGTSQQECAKIAQYIAQLHEKQRAEALRLGRIRQQGYADATKVALNTHTIPSKSQISDLLALTMKGKVNSMKDSPPIIKSSTHPGGSESVSPLETALPSTAAQKETSEQAVKKYYLANKNSLSKMKTNESGNINVGATSVPMKPVFSMVVPKSLTGPGQKEQLIKTVAAKIANHKILPKPQVSVGSPSVSRHIGQSNVFEQQFSEVTLCNPLVQQGPYVQSPNVLVPSTVNTTQLNVQTDYHNVINQNQSPMLNSAGMQNLNTLASASLSMLGQIPDPQTQQIMGVQQAGLQTVQQLFVSSVHQNPPIIQQQDPVLATPLYAVSQPSYETQAFMNTQDLASTQVILSQTADVLQSTPVQNIVTVQQFPQQQTAFGFENITSGNALESSFTPQSIGYPIQEAPELLTAQSKSSGAKTFVNPPELSPAVVQQILTSLKRTGAMAMSKKQSSTVNKEKINLSSKDSSIRAQTSTSVSGDESKMTLQMKLQHVLKNKDDPNVRKSVLEAAQKISQLRKEFSQVSTSQSTVVATTTASTTVAQVKKPAGVVSHLIKEENEKDKQSPSLASAQTSANVPELPDLGSKEFQIDSILALDEGVVENKVKESSGHKSEVLQVGSDQEMISHIQSFIGGTAESSTLNEIELSKTASRNANSTYLNANRIAKERESKSLQGIAKSTLESQNEYSETSRSDVVCPKCKACFRRADELSNHNETCGCEDNTLACDICKFQFSSLTALKDHVKMACCAKQTVGTAKTNQLKDDEFTYVYKCSKCRFANVGKSKVLSHVKTSRANMIDNHHDAELCVLFRCNMCGEVLPDKEATYRHVSRLCPQLRLINNQKEVQGVYDKLLLSNAHRNTQKTETLNKNHPHKLAPNVKKEEPQQQATQDAKKTKDPPRKTSAKTIQRIHDFVNRTLNTENSSQSEGLRTEIEKEQDKQSEKDKQSENTDIPHEELCQSEKKSEQRIQDFVHVPLKAERPSPPEGNRTIQKEHNNQAESTDVTHEQKRLMEKMDVEEFNTIETRKKNMNLQKEEHERLAKLKLAKEKGLKNLISTRDSKSTPLMTCKNDTDKNSKDLKEREKGSKMQIIGKSYKEEIKLKEKALNEQTSGDSLKRGNKSRDTLSARGHKEETKSKENSTKAASQKVSIEENVLKEKTMKNQQRKQESSNQERAVTNDGRTRTSSRIKILHKSLLKQDARKRKGLRARSLIKKRKFLDEIEPEGTGSRREIQKEQCKRSVNTDDDSLNDETKTLNDETKTCHECHLCKHRCWGNKYHLVQHYVRKHNFGFKADKVGYCCRFCRYKLSILRSLEIKSHVLSHWKSIIPRISSLAETAGKNTKSVPSQVKKNTKSPLKSDRVAKHLKAMALRNKCAENLKKIAIRRASADSATPTQEDKSEQETQDSNVDDTKISSDDEGTGLNAASLPIHNYERKLIATRKRSRSSSLSSRSSMNDLSSIVQNVKDRRIRKPSQNLGCGENDQSSQDEKKSVFDKRVQDSSSFVSESSQSDTEERINSDVRKRRLSTRLRNLRISKKSYFNDDESVNNDIDEQEIIPRRTRSHSTQHISIQSKDEGIIESDNSRQEKTDRILLIQQAPYVPSPNALVLSTEKKVKEDGKQVDKKAKVTEELAIADSSDSNEASGKELNISSSSLRSNRKEGLNNKMNVTNVESQENKEDHFLGVSKTKDTHTFESDFQMKEFDTSADTAENGIEKAEISTTSRDKVSGHSLSILLNPEEEFDPFTFVKDNCKIEEPRKPEQGMADFPECDSDIAVPQVCSNVALSDLEEHVVKETDKPENQLMSPSAYESVFQRFVHASGCKESEQSQESAHINVSEENVNFIGSFQNFIAEQSALSVKRKRRQVKRNTNDKESDDTSDDDADIMLQKHSANEHHMHLKYNLKQCVVKVERLKESNFSEIQERRSSPTNEIIIVEDSNDCSDIQLKEGGSALESEPDRTTVQTCNVPSLSLKAQNPQQVNVEVSPSKTLPLIFIAHDNNTVDIVQSCVSPSDESNCSSSDMPSGTFGLNETNKKVCVDGHATESAVIDEHCIDEGSDLEKQKLSGQSKRLFPGDNENKFITDKTQQSVPESQSDSRSKSPHTETCSDRKIESQLEDPMCGGGLTNPASSEVEMMSTLNKPCTQTREINSTNIRVPIADTDTIHTDEGNSCSSSESVTEITLDSLPQNSDVCDVTSANLETSTDDEHQNSRNCLVVLKAEEGSEKEKLSIVNEVNIELSLHQDNIAVERDPEDDAPVNSEMISEKMSDSEDHETLKHGDYNTKTDHLNQIKQSQSEENEKQFQLPISSSSEGQRTCEHETNYTRSEENIYAPETDKTHQGGAEIIYTPQTKQSDLTSYEEETTSETETKDSGEVENIVLSDSITEGLFELCRKDIRNDKNIGTLAIELIDNENEEKTEILETSKNDNKSCEKTRTPEMELIDTGSGERPEIFDNTKYDNRSDENIGKLEIELSDNESEVKTRTCEIGRKDDRSCVKIETPTIELSDNESEETTGVIETFRDDNKSYEYIRTPEMELSGTGSEEGTDIFETTRHDKKSDENIVPSVVELCENEIKGKNRPFETHRNENRSNKKIIKNMEISDSEETTGIFETCTNDSRSCEEIVNAEVELNDSESDEKAGVIETSRNAISSDQKIKTPIMELSDSGCEEKTGIFITGRNDMSSGEVIGKSEIEIQEGENKESESREKHISNVASNSQKLNNAESSRFFDDIIEDETAFVGTEVQVEMRLHTKDEINLTRAIIDNERDCVTVNESTNGAFDTRIVASGEEKQFNSLVNVSSKQVDMVKDTLKEQCRDELVENKDIYSASEQLNDQCFEKESNSQPLRQNVHLVDTDNVNIVNSEHIETYSNSVDQKEPNSGIQVDVLVKNRNIHHTEIHDSASNILRNPNDDAHSRQNKVKSYDQAVILQPCQTIHENSDTANTDQHDTLNLAFDTLSGNVDEPRSSPQVETVSKCSKAGVEDGSVEVLHVTSNTDRLDETVISEEDETIVLKEKVTSAHGNDSMKEEIMTDAHVEDSICIVGSGHVNLLEKEKDDAFNSFETVDTLPIIDVEASSIVHTEDKNRVAQIETNANQLSSVQDKLSVVNDSESRETIANPGENVHFSVNKPIHNASDNLDPEDANKEFQRTAAENRKILTAMQNVAEENCDQAEQKSQQGRPESPSKVMENERTSYAESNVEPMQCQLTNRCVSSNSTSTTHELNEANATGFPLSSGLCSDIIENKGEIRPGDTADKKSSCTETYVNQGETKSAIFKSGCNESTENTGESHQLHELIIKSKHYIGAQDTINQEKASRCTSGEDVKEIDTFQLSESLDVPQNTELSVDENESQLMINHENLEDTGELPYEGTLQSFVSGCEGVKHKEEVVELETTDEAIKEEKVPIALTSETIASNSECHVQEKKEEDRLEEFIGQNIIAKIAADHCNHQVDILPVFSPVKDYQRKRVKGVNRAEQDDRVQRCFEQNENVLESHSIIECNDLVEETMLSNVLTNAPLRDNAKAGDGKDYEDTKLDSKRSSRLRDRPKKDYKTISKGSMIKKDTQEPNNELHKETNEKDPAKMNNSSRQTRTNTSNRSRSSSRSNKLIGPTEHEEKTQKAVNSSSLCASGSKRSICPIQSAVKADSNSSTHEVCVRTRSRSGEVKSTKSINATETITSCVSPNSTAHTQTVSPNRTRVKSGNLSKTKNDPLTVNLKKVKINKETDNEEFPVKRQKVGQSCPQEGSSDKPIEVKKIKPEPMVESELPEEKDASEAFVRRMEMVRRRSSVHAYESDFSLDGDMNEDKTNKNECRESMKTEAEQTTATTENKTFCHKTVTRKCNKPDTSDNVDSSNNTRSRHGISLSPEKATLSSMALKLSKKGEADLENAIGPNKSIKNNVMKKYSPRASKKKDSFKPIFREPKGVTKMSNNEEPPVKKAKLSESAKQSDPDTNKDIQGQSKVKSFRQLHKQDKPFQWESSPTRELRHMSDSSSVKKQKCQEKNDEMQETGNSKHQLIGKNVNESKSVASVKKTAVSNKGKNTENAVIEIDKSSAHNRHVETTRSKPAYSGKDVADTKVKGNVNVKRLETNTRSNERKLKSGGSFGKVVEKRKLEKSKHRNRSRSRSRSKDVSEEKVSKVKLQKASQNTEPSGKQELKTSGVKGDKRETTTSNKKKVNDKTARIDATKKERTLKSSDWKEEPNDTCKLDGTVGSPSKMPASDPCVECSAKREKFCGKCSRNSPTKQSPTGSRVVNSDSKRPTVRQIVHGGIVFEIQKGSVTETEIQKQAKSASDVKCSSTSTSTNCPRVRTRSTKTDMVGSQKVVNSPESVVDMCMQGETVAAAGGNNLNEYIHRTLDEIRRQRVSGQQTSKWKVQKRSTIKAPKFPYAFKKRR